jgi:LAS superfamily LD-carboxypeptidase LdcB
VGISGTWYLSGLWPPFSEAVQYLLAWAQYYQLEGSIVSGYRSIAEQDALYRQGRTSDQIARRVALHGAGGSVTDAPGGQSAHNYGLAVDIEGPHQAQIIELARAIGFGTVSWDPAHIEWPRWATLVSR